MTKPTAAIVLAAGQGTRMRSKLPKVLHQLFGEPLLVHVLRAASQAGCEQLVVVVNPQHRRAIEQALAPLPLAAKVTYAEQAVARGTGDAARAGLTAVATHCQQVLVLCGDTPMIAPETLADLLAARGERDLAVLACRLADPSGYGRVITGAAGAVQGIVEHKDASAEQLEINLVNSGVYAVDTRFLRTAVANLKADNAQGEYYLTDVVAAAAERGSATVSVLAAAEQARGVNSRVDLAAVERAWQQQMILAHSQAGVTFVAPHMCTVGPRVVLEPDVVIGPGVQLLGDCHVCAGARIDGPSVLTDVRVGPEAHVKAFSHLVGAVLAERAEAGPFARLRPGAALHAQAHVGNFVEIKQATMGEGAKAGHLAYIGDATIGPRANIGAGTIVCNYDGFAKHRTQIGANAFVGSNATLVAPVRIGDDSIVAAGSTITEDVAADALAFGRAKQVTLTQRARALREKLARAKEAKSTGG